MSTKYFMAISLRKYGSGNEAVGARPEGRGATALKLEGYYKLVYDSLTFSDHGDGLGGKGMLKVGSLIMISGSSASGNNLPIRVTTCARENSSLKPQKRPLGGTNYE
jgi:hypothetical protein